MANLYRLRPGNWLEDVMNWEKLHGERFTQAYMKRTHQVMKDNNITCPSFIITPTKIGKALGYGKRIVVESLDERDLFSTLTEEESQNSEHPIVAVFN